jgi:hypothetical protein
MNRKLQRIENPWVGSDERLFGFNWRVVPTLRILLLPSLVMKRWDILLCEQRLRWSCSWFPYV